MCRADASHFAGRARSLSPSVLREWCGLNSIRASGGSVCLDPELRRARPSSLGRRAEGPHGDVAVLGSGPLVVAPQLVRG
jgi:hypothetical protein